MNAKSLFVIGAGALIGGVGILALGGNIFGIGATTQADINKTAISQIEAELDSLRSNLSVISGASEVEKFRSALIAHVDAVDEAASHLKPPTREVFDAFDICGVFLLGVGIGMVVCSQVAAHSKERRSESL